MNVSAQNFSKPYIKDLTFYIKSYIIIVSGGSTSPDTESCEVKRAPRGPDSIAKKVTAAPKPDK